jgi:ATP-dependent exoDNAse (exonuclease V) alpha subunit
MIARGTRRLSRFAAHFGGTGIESAMPMQRMTTFTPQQDQALKAVSAWMKQPKEQIFRLFGYAGTGKTTLAKEIAEGVSGDVLFGAFTGKAASVMRSKGCVGASTIHSMIYRSRGTDEEDAPRFVLNRQSEVKKARLVIIDECSMVDEPLGRDLLTFGTKLLVLGDPAQLPPVQGGGYFTAQEPDVMLTEVHRQAAGNAIIRLSMQVRAGEPIERGDHGEAKVIRRADLGQKIAMQADQILVGRNQTRREVNQKIRALRGFDGSAPVAGEKIVCLKNNKEKGLLNGGTWTVKERAISAKGVITMRALSDDAPEDGLVKVSVLPEFFLGTEEQVPYSKRREFDEFDYGYALTVHKAQGSQWDEVVLFDESFAFREHRERWLYTGITRAAERLTIVV